MMAPLLALSLLSLSVPQGAVPADVGSPQGAKKTVKDTAKDTVKDTTKDTAKDTAKDTGAKTKASPIVTKLKDRIHDMRMSLLLGGDRVRKAEAEALDFYQRRGKKVEQLIGTVGAELTEKRAEYDVVLQRILVADSPQSRSASVAEASKLRRKIATLETEAEDLRKGRARYQQATSMVKARARQRERLAAQVESGARPDLLSAVPLPGIGLAPEPSGGSEDASLLSQPGLLDDLLRRDPQRARQVLMETNPKEYWRRWPLRPPARVLHRALPFPLPDLPGKR